MGTLWMFSGDWQQYICSRFVGSDGLWNVTINLFLSIMLDQIRIHGFVSYSCVSRVPVFCNLVGASCC